MTGTPRTGDIEIPLNFTGDTWNLIGNPYTSTIETAKLLTETLDLMDEDILWYLWLGW